MNRIKYLDQEDEKEVIGLFNSLQDNLLILKKSLTNIANCVARYNSDTKELANEAETWRVA